MATRQHDGTMANPNVITDNYAMRATPGEEVGLVLRASEISAGAIGEMRLACPMHRVIARIDPGHRRDRAEFSDVGIGDIAIVNDIRVVAELDLQELGSGADFRIATKCAGDDERSRLDQRLR